MAKDVAEEFNSSLADLRINSKPHINMLTMLAEDYIEHAPIIVKSVESHLYKVRDEVKLPILYLIDSIVKNIGKDYITLFAQNIVSDFCTVFERGDEKIRSQMFKLRQTWNELFPSKVLYELDARTNSIDPAWPITAPPPRIHFNPKFLNRNNQPGIFPPIIAEGGIMREELLKQQKELLELQKQKVELELLQTKAILVEQQKKLDHQTNTLERDFAQAKSNVAILVSAAEKSVESEISQMNSNSSSFRSRDPRMRAKQNSKSSVSSISSGRETKISPVKTNSNRHKKDKRDKKLKENRRQLAIRTEYENPSRTPPLKPIKDQDINDSNITKNKEVRSIENTKIKSDDCDLRKTDKHNQDELSKLSRSNSTESAETEIQITPPLYEVIKTDESSNGSSQQSGESFNPTRKKTKVEDLESNETTADPILGTNDVDLRVLANETETPDDIMLENLFGDEDVDLRQCAPQPPVGSEKSWANIKKTNECTSPDLKKCKISKRPTFQYNREETQQVQQITLQEDDNNLRNNCNLIIKQAEDQLSNGNITFTEYNHMLKAVLTMNEERKLQEAIWRDELESQPKSVENNVEMDVEYSNNKRKYSSVKEDSNVKIDEIPPDLNGSYQNDRNLMEWKQEHVEEERPRYSTRFHPMNRDPNWMNRPQRGQHKPQPVFNRWPHMPPGGPRPMFDSTKPPPFRFHDRGGHRFGGMRPSGFREVPPADPHVLDLIAKDTMHTIDVDRVPHQVRFYGETAVILSSWDDPRELSFQPGTGSIVIDDRHVFQLQFNTPYREFNIDGVVTKIRFGAPTRELYIDGVFYEASFGGPPIQVMIGNRLHSIKLTGPLPQVRVGTVPRTDLVAGKVNLIVDAKHMYPIYLDAKPQRFDIGGIPYILRFVEALQTVVINGVPFKIEFGGNLPVPMYFHGEKHFLRFSVLPRNVKPGYVNIVNMEGGRLPTPPPMLGPPPPPSHVMLPNDPSLYPPDIRDLQPPPLPPATHAYHTGPPPSDQNLELLASLMHTTPSQPRRQNYTLETETPLVQQPLQLEENINVTELFKKLVAVGIVPPANEQSQEEEAAVKPVSFAHPETLKVKQPALIAMLYSGIQCSSCGVRFPPEQTVKYSQHLDWHFRQNRRDRDTVKRVLSRRWNYDISDWIQYLEIEEEEERPESWFEIQEREEENEAADQAEDVPCVSLQGDDNICCVCHDRFEQFFNGDKEEWQLRQAVRVNNKLYHPLCQSEEKSEITEPLLDESQVNDSETIEIEDNTTEIAEEERAEPVEEEEKESTEPQPMNESSDDDILEVKVLEKTVEFYELSDEDIEEPKSTEENETCKNGDEDKSTEPIEEISDSEIDFTLVKIKQERVDPSTVNPPAVVSSIDGNNEVTDTTHIVIPKIKINITSSLARQDKSKDGSPDVREITETEGLIRHPASVKERITKADLKVLDPVEKDSEMSGLCSIM